MKRDDDFESRRRHLKSLSDAELHAHFWRLAERIVAPLVDESRTHTSPSIERSVLLRMGLSSLEAKAIVDRLSEEGHLGQGAGRLLLELARRRKITVREAADSLMAGKHWEDLVP